MMIVGVIAILVFGKRLPEIARTVGKGWAEFQRAIQGIQSEITSAVTSEGHSAPRTVYHDETEEHEEATAPKFEPPPSPPRPPVEPVQQT
jgi:sec-independent protein translocase protein TatA